MSEFTNWEKVIPNFQEGDEIIPLEDKFQERMELDYILDGGFDHRDILQSCALVRRKGSGKEGVYNQKGEQIVPEEFDKCELKIYNSGDFYVTGIRVQKEDLYGFYNGEGQLIVPVEYTYLYIRANFVVVRGKNGMYGVYLINGKKIIDCEYDNIEVFGSLDDGFGCALIQKNGLFGVKLETGEEVVPVKFNHINKITDGYIVYSTKTESSYLKGWYSRDGKSNIPCLFESLDFKYYKKINVVTSEGLQGIYSYDGRELVPPKFKSINYVGNYFVGLIDDFQLSLYDENGNFLYSTIK